VYLPPTLHIDVATGTGIEAPLLFHLPFARPAGTTPGDGEPREHPSGARRVVGVRLERVDAFGDELATMLSGTGIRCEAGAAEECLHVQLSGLNAGVELDLRPEFALRLHA